MVDSKQRGRRGGYSVNVLTDGVLRCFHCKERKDLTCFRKYKSKRKTPGKWGASGYSSVCIECKRKEQSIKNKIFREKVKNDPELHKKDRDRRKELYYARSLEERSRNGKKAYQRRKETGYYSKQRYNIYCNRQKAKWGTEFPLSYEEYRQFIQKPC